MQIPLLIKIRIAVIAAVGVLAFWLVGWRVLYSQPDPMPMTAVLSGQPWSVVGVGVILVLGVTLAAAVAARPYVGQLAPLGAVAGLTTWAVMSPTMNSLLLANPMYSQRVEVFNRLMVDTVFWFGLVMLAELVSAGAAKAFGKPGLPPLPSGLLAAKSSEAQSDDSSAKTPADGDQVIRYAVSLAVMVAAAIILVKLFARGGEVRLDQLPESPMVGTTPKMGQIVFAVVGAFTLATMAGFHVFAGPMRLYLLGPAITAAAGYLITAHHSGLPALQNAAAVFVPSSMTWATITPLQYLALGSLGVLIGFWFSVSLHLPKPADESAQ